MGNKSPRILPPAPEWSLPAGDLLRFFDVSQEFLARYALHAILAVRGRGSFRGGAARRTTPMQDAESLRRSMCASRGPARASFKLLWRASEAAGSGALPESERLLDRAVALDPRRPLPVALRGQVRKFLGDTTAAYRDMNKATKLDPFCAGFWIAKGDIAHALGEDARAVACFDRASLLHPNACVSFRRMGERSAQAS